MVRHDLFATGLQLPSGIGGASSSSSLPHLGPASSAHAHAPGGPPKAPAVLPPTKGRTPGGEPGPGPAPWGTPPAAPLARRLALWFICREVWACIFRKTPIWPGSSFQ